VAEETQTTTASATFPEPDPKLHYFWGVGRRKSAVARVRVRAGEGKFMINKRELDAYFVEEKDRQDAIAPLKATQTFGKVDVFVNVKGGGSSGQAGAIVLGVARALKTANPEYDDVLRAGGYLTRDSRMVERKKPGKPGARKSFQFSKR